MKVASAAKKIAVLAVMAALLVAGKAALTAIANVEVVSLFCALFGYVFGVVSVIPVCILITIITTSCPSKRYVIPIIC